MNYQILVNKNHPIKNNEISKNLVIIAKNLFPIDNVDDDEFIYLDEQAACYLNKMLNDCNNLFKSKVIPSSGYRSIEHQKKILDFYLRYDQRGSYAYNTVALPSQSEHHTGLAVDVSIIKDLKECDIVGNEPEIMWLYNNCSKYGFILRYPKGKEQITGYDYEPWHFRYVGVDIAKYIMENNLTLEEYLS